MAFSADQIRALRQQGATSIVVDMHNFQLITRDDVSAIYDTLDAFWSAAAAIPIPIAFAEGRNIINIPPAVRNQMENSPSDRERMIIANLESMGVRPTFNEPPQ